MEIQEKKQIKLPTEKEIQDSLNRYMGFLHPKINILGDLDYKRIIEMSRKGWNLDFTEEELYKRIDDFVNIYGYIYKEGERDGRNDVKRGTTTNEVKKMREGSEISTILSTTTDENVAKSFGITGNDGKNALIRIGVGKNLPYKWIEHIKKENYSYGKEDEILILPFSKIKKMEFISDWRGFKYYDVELEKGEMPEIEDEKLEQLKEECISNYAEFMRMLKEYEEIDYPFGYEDQKRTLEKNMENYKTKFTEMLKGLCSQREKNIDLSIENEKENQILESKMQQIKDSQRTREGVDANISEFLGIIQKYKDMSETLGLKTFNTRNVRNNIDEKWQKIQQNKVEEDAEKISEEQCENLKNQDEEIVEKLAQTPDLLKKYDQISMMDLKLKLSEKVQNIICKATYNNLENERKAVALSKDTLLNRILGKTRLKKEKIKNIEQKMFYASQKEKTGISLDVRQMIESLYEYALQYNNGNLTQEMVNIEKAIRETFGNIENLPSQEELATKIQQVQNRWLPVKRNQSRFSFLQNRREAKRLQEESKNIYEKTKAMDRKSKIQDDLGVERGLINIYGKYNRILGEIEKIVNKNAMENEIQNENVR